MAKSKDIKQVDAVIIKFGMSDEQGWGYRDYIHQLKGAGHGGSGKKGDFTFKELCQIARDYLGLNDE